MTAESGHELARAYARASLPLHPTLVEMLDEHHSHRTERRGCGYTQATRYLADQINLAQRSVDGNPGSLLAQPPQAADVHAVLHNIDAALRGIGAQLLHRLIVDRILGSAVPDSLPVIASKLKIGSCPLAEKFFLEIAHRRVRRGGLVNVIVDAQGSPLLVEKRGLGDDHSCISVGALVLHGVRLPVGSLVGVDYDGQAVADRALPLRSVPGSQIPAAAIRGARFMRLTTLAVPPAQRAATFTEHYQQQVENQLFSPDSTTIEQLQGLALEQVA